MILNISIFKILCIWKLFLQVFIRQVLIYLAIYLEMGGGGVEKVANTGQKW